MSKTLEDLYEIISRGRSNLIAGENESYDVVIYPTEYPIGAQLTLWGLEQAALPSGIWNVIDKHIKIANVPLSSFTESLLNGLAVEYTSPGRSAQNDSVHDCVNAIADNVVFDLIVSARVGDGDNFDRVCLPVAATLHYAAPVEAGASGEWSFEVNLPDADGTGLPQEVLNNARVSGKIVWRYVGYIPMEE